MALEFLNFPVEIQEKILSCLTGQSLFVASKVCKLWMTLCGRIARERFRKIIPAECLFEEEENQNESLDEVWLRTMNYHYLQLCFVNNMLDYKKEFVFNTVNSSNLCFCSYGPLVFIGDDKSFINIYNTKDNFQPKNSLYLENGSILQLQVVNHEKILISLSSSSFEFFTLPKPKGKDWDYNMRRLTVIFQNHSGPLNCYRNVSVGGNHIAIVTNPCEVSVFRLNRIQDEIVQIIYVSQLVTEHAIVQTGIWSDEVIILLTTGEIVQWFLSSEMSNVSEAYQEIRYQNPAWIMRGRIFCSTIISSKLLGYWHMDRGASYWLIGSPSSTLVRCRDLGTMFSADSNIEDVLCVAMKQRILACGTKEGKVLIYYLSNIFFNMEEDDLYPEYNSNSYIKREFDRVPDLTIRTKERPIKDIKIEFTEYSIHIYTWPYLTSSGPGSQGPFQCIILSEGDWVTQSEREAIDI